MKRYILPELPYDSAALEPHYSARLLQCPSYAVWRRRNLGHEQRRLAW